MAGVLVAVMFLLLLCILFTIFMCRREKRSRTSPRPSPPHQQKADHQLTAGGPVWSTQASGLSVRPQYHRPAVAQQLPVRRFQTGGRRQRPDGMTESLCDSEESGQSSFEQPRHEKLSAVTTAAASLSVSRLSSESKPEGDDEVTSRGIINYGHDRRLPATSAARPRVQISPTSSKSSSSSAPSNASFETERSVGEIDRLSGSCVIFHPAPSLHETHFGLGAEEDPLTILHPPNSGLRWAQTGSTASMTLDHEASQQRKISCTKSEGRAALQAAQQLPLSSYYYLPGSRPASTLGLLPGDGRPGLPQRLSTPTCPGSLLSTAAASASSVFQCQHDCFMLEHHEEQQQLEQLEVGEQLEAVVQQIAQQFHPGQADSDTTQRTPQ